MSRKTNRYHGKSSWQKSRLTGKPYKAGAVTAQPPCPPRELLLEVKTEYFSASAVWRKVYGVWHCHSADPVIRWMKGMNQDTVKVALLQMGAEFHWTVQQQTPVVGDTRDGLDPAQTTVVGTRPQSRGITSRPELGTAEPTAEALDPTPRPIPRIMARPNENRLHQV